MGLQRQLLGDQEGRRMLKPNTLRGMTLIELMVGLTIIAFLLVSGMPSLSVWLGNAQIRGAAESILTGLNHARAEAVKRNTSVRFQLTTTLGNDCALSTSGTNWVVNIGASTSPAGLCATATSDTTAPYLLQKSVATGSSTITINAGQNAVAFNGFGQQTSINPGTTPVSAVTISIVPSGSGTCLSSSGTGTYRCLTIQVSPAGQARLCDPSVSGSASSNPTACI